MIRTLRNISGVKADPQGDGLAAVHARLATLKSKGGPEIEAHAHCNSNRDALAASELAGCFYCCSVFRPAEIEDWIDDERCAMCPSCGIDSVIGTASGFPVSDVAFLQRMREIWF